MEAPLSLIALSKRKKHVTSSPFSEFVFFACIIQLVSHPSSSPLSSLIIALSPSRIAGGAALGDPEESAGDELRQALEVSAVLLREGDYAEGGR